MTEPVRICLVGCTGLLGDIIVDAVDRDPQIAVVANVGTRSDLQDLADTGQVLDEVDLVVWNCADESQVSGWLDTSSHGPRVLAAVEDGRQAALWELAPRRTALGWLSPPLLTEVIRTRGHRAN